MVAAEPYFGHSAEHERHPPSVRLPKILLRLKKSSLDFAQRGGHHAVAFERLPESIFGKVGLFGR